MRQGSDAKLHRREQLLALVRQHGFTTVPTLAAELGLSESTVRRELRQLREEGSVNRVFGGAMPNGDELSFTPRSQAFIQEKRLIGRRAAQLAAPGETLILDTGTTVLAVAASLRTVPHIDIVTSSVDVVVALQDAPNVRLFLTGGAFDPHTHTLLGPEAERFYAGARADKMFIGVGSLSASGLRDSNVNAFAIKQAAMAAASSVIVVADHSKFTRDALADLSGWGENFTLVTDARTPDAALRAIREFGVRVIRA